MKKTVSLVLLLWMICQLAACTVSTNASGGQETGKSLDFSAQYICTDGYQENAQFPQVEILCSTDDLMAYYNEKKEIFFFEESLTFTNACQKYDQDFFQNNLVIFVVLEEPSGSIRHKVKDVSLETSGDLAVNIQSIVPEWGDDDMAQWHIMIELKKENDIRDVTVFLDGENATDPIIPKE